MTGPDDRSIGEVVGDIAGNIGQIVHAELQLARAELREDAAAVKRGLVVMSIGALVGGLAGGFALMGVVAPWAAAAIVAGGAAVMAALFVTTGIKRLQQVGLPRTAASIQESVQWAKTRAR